MHRSRNILRRTALSAAAAMVFGGFALMSIDPADATPVASMAATATHATQFGSGDVLNGMVPFTKPIHIEVALKLRNTDQLQSLLAAPPAPLTPAQFTAMQAREARTDRAWISRATRSFPTPLSPVMSTLASPAATRPTSARISAIWGLALMMSG